MNQNEFWVKLIDAYQQTNLFGRLLGLHLIEANKGNIVYELTITQNYLATPNAAHGGVIAAMMDGVLGVAALSVSSFQKKLVATVEFKINYLSPAYLNETLVGKGNVIFAGNRIITAEGIIVEKTSGRLIAKAMGTFNAYPYEKSGMKKILES